MSLPNLTALFTGYIHSTSWHHSFYFNGFAKCPDDFQLYGESASFYIKIDHYQGYAGCGTWERAETGYEKTCQGEHRLQSDVPYDYYYCAGPHIESIRKFKKIWKKDIISKPL